LTTTVIRDRSGFSVSPTARLSILNPREENIPETCARTPALFWTSAESTWRIRPEPRAIISETDLVFEVVDEGPGFDLDECTVDCTTDENLTREEGRGLFLMRQLMDRVESFRDKGNVVRLTLHRP